MYINAYFAVNCTHTLSIECCAFGCTNYDNKESRNHGITFHKYVFYQN